MRKILIIGAPSAGKTTILSRVFYELRTSTDLKMKWIPDVGRIKEIDTSQMRFAESKEFLSNAIFSLFLTRLLNEIEQVDLINQFEYDIAFIDENVLAEYSMGTVMKINPKYLQIMKMTVDLLLDRYDMIFYTRRNLENEFFKQMDKVIYKVLKSRKNVVFLTGDVASKVKIVLQKLV